MKKLLIFLAIICALYTGFTLFSCTKPLEGPLEDNEFPPDTIYVTDTLTFTDTVIIVIPDTGSAQMQCGRLNSHRKELVWMFRNEPGVYSMDFRAIVEYDNPSRLIVIDIDGEQHFWHLNETLEYIIEPTLGDDAVVRVSTIPPHAYGHAIDICLIIEYAD
jgi:hypothetical protein